MVQVKTWAEIVDGYGENVRAPMTTQRERRLRRAGVVVNIMAAFGAMVLGVQVLFEVPLAIEMLVGVIAVEFIARHAADAHEHWRAS